MTNRAAVVVIALVVGVGLYGGLLFVEDRLTEPRGPTTSGEVVAANTTMHLDRIGRPTVVGQVVNGRGTPVTDATLTVQFYRDGRLLGTATGATLVPTIDGGGTSPFSVRLDDREARPDDHVVTLAYDTSTDRPYIGLTVAETVVADRSQSQIILVGTVRNAGGQSVSVNVVATFYDAEGDVVGVRSARPSPAVLAPGDDGEFSLRFRTLGDLPSRAAQVDRWDLVVFGEPVS